MTLTPRYTLWLEMLAARDSSTLVLFLLAAAVVGFVYYARRWRQRLLWMGVAAFWWTLIVFLFINPPAIPRPTFGLLMGQPLWYDETFTVHVARLPLDRMMQAVAGDVHPPLWYVVEWAMVRLLGESAWAVRLPALLFGLASVYLTYRLALALGHERKTALWAAGLLALMPAQVYYAQEARMYTLIEFCVLLAVLGLVECRFYLMCVGLLGVVYTHNLGVLFALVIGLLALWRERKTALWAVVSAGVTVLLYWLPWLTITLRQVQAVGGGFWIQASSLGGYLLPLYRLTLGMGAVGFVEQHAAMAAAGLAALALWAAVRAREWVIISLAMVLGPAMALVLISELWRPLYLERVFLVSLPFLMILVALALRRMRSEHRRPILAVLLPLLAICLLFQSKGTEGYGAFASSILEHYEGGDTIYHVNLASYIQMRYYLPEAEHVCWPDAGNLQQALSLETQAAMGIRRAEAAEVWDRERRLFVVGMLHPMSTAGEERALEEALELGQARKIVAWEDSELVTAGVWEVRP